MFEIVDVFHITHVVDDLDAAVAWYDDVFSPVLFQRTEVLNSALALMVVGDVVLMPLMPSTDIPTPAGKFRSRFGQHLHSLAVHLDGPEAFMEHMAALGHDLTGARGGAVEGPGDEIWTRPRDFAGLYELWAPRIDEDPRLRDDWSSAYWREEHPLGLTGPAWVTVVAADREDSVAGLAAAFAAPRLREVERTPYETSSTFLGLGPNVTLEVAQPLHPDCPAAVDLDTCGEILHSVTFVVRDVEAAAAHLRGKGLAVDQPAEGQLVVDPDHAFGVRFRFSQRPFMEW